MYSSKPWETASAFPTEPKIHRYQAAVSPPVWCVDGYEICVGDQIRLARPLTYVVAGKDRTEPAAIRIGMPVSAEPYLPTTRELLYWPRFDELTPGQRRYYLDWMAAGRIASPTEVGYAFLFFYGLERRALIDRKDIPSIFDEVVRMRIAFDGPTEPFHRGFAHYTTSFLFHLLVEAPKSFTTTQFRSAFKLSRMVRSEQCVAGALSWLWGSGYVLPDWVAFDLVSSLPHAKRSVVTTRVGEELERVFRARYADRFGKGLTLQAPREQHQFQYRPASSALPASVVSAPSPMNLPAQFQPLVGLWNQCIDDLRRLSTIVSHGSGMTAEHWRALPPELRKTVDHPLLDRFVDFIAAHAGESGDTLVSLHDLAKLLGIEKDKKISIAVARHMAEAVEEVGYCIEPDARFSGRGYEEHSPVTLYLNMIPTAIDPSRYRAVSALLEVCIAVVSADGAMDERELTVLAHRINEVFEFNEAEHRRLDALRALRLACHTPTTDACRSVKRLERPQRELVGRLMVAVVAGNGPLTAKQVKAVRKVYAAIGLDRSNVSRVIAGLMPVEDLPTVAAAVAGPTGEKIPPQPEDKLAAPIVLDPVVVAAKLAETREVARMLAAAMNVEAMEEPSVSAIAPPPVTDAKQLSPEVAAFYERVISKPAWTRDELTALARSQGLMLAGVLESLNDWSTERHGGPLLYEDGDQITLELAYLD